MLTLAFRRLPRLTEFGLGFCESLEQVYWLRPLLCLGLTLEERSAAHHVKVVSTAINSTWCGNFSIPILHLSGLSLPPDDPWPSIDRSLVIEALYGLLTKIPKVRVLQSDTVLEIMRHSTLEIRQLELCSTYVSCHVLEEFFRNNINSMESISFHNVETTGTSELTTRNLCPADLSKMAFLPAMKISRISPCPCSCQKWWLSNSSFEALFERA